MLTYTLSGSDLFTIDGTTGQIRVVADGSLDYDDRTARTHVVTVEASDSSNAIATISVTINVTDVNEPPDAGDDTATTPEDAAVTIDVLNNDSDPEDDRSELLLTVFNSGTNAPRNGTVMVNEPVSAGQNRTITYTPNADYHGSDTFTYRVSDTDSPSLSSTASVTVEVDPVNDAPTFVESTPTRTVSVSAQAGDNVGAPVEAMDVDEDDTLTYSIEGPEAVSFAIDSGSGQITVGADVIFDTDTYTFDVVADDGNGETARVELAITVTARRSSGGGGGGGGGFGGPILTVTTAVVGDAPANLTFGFVYTCANTRGELLSTRTFTVASGRTFGLLIAAGLSCSLAVSDDGGATAVDGLFTDLVIPRAGHRTTVTFTFGPVTTAVALDTATVVEDAGVSLSIPAGSREAPYAVLLETDSDSCEAALDLEGESLACYTVSVFDGDGAEETDVTLLVPATITITLDAARVEALGGIDGVRAARERGELRMRQRADAESPWRELPFSVLETADGGAEIVVSVYAFSDFALVSTTPRTQTVALYADWNVVVWDGADGASIPDALGDIAGQVDVIYQWLAETQTWRSHRPAGPAILSAFDTFTRGATYWIRSSEAAEWTVVGGPLDPPATEPVRLHARWTEVVWRGAEGAGITEALGADVLPQVEVIYRWLAEPQSWTSFRPGAPAIVNAFDRFTLGASYWIAVTEAMQWVVAGDGG